MSIRPRLRRCGVGRDRSRPGYRPCQLWASKGRPAGRSSENPAAARPRPDAEAALDWVAQRPGITAMGYQIKCVRSCGSGNGWANNVLELLSTRDEAGHFKANCGHPGYVEKRFALQEVGEYWETF